MTITENELLEMDKRYRATFVNSLPGYKCLHMVGTVNGAGSTNLALFNSVFHLGANPALLGMVVRPDSADHDTLDNINESGEYTLNNVLPGWYMQSHQTSARFPSGVSEFGACGFTKYYTDQFKAPFVLESTIKIGLKKREVIDVSINKTTIVIGEICRVILEPSIIAGDGYVNHIKAASVTVAGLDSYFTAKHLARLAYAKAGENPHKLKIY